MVENKPAGDGSMRRFKVHPVRVLAVDLAVAMIVLAALPNPATAHGLDHVGLGEVLPYVVPLQIAPSPSAGLTTATLANARRVGVGPSIRRGFAEMGHAKLLARLDAGPSSPHWRRSVRTGAVPNERLGAVSWQVPARPTPAVETVKPSATPTSALDSVHCGTVSHKDSADVYDWRTVY